MTTPVESTTTWNRGGEREERLVQAFFVLYKNARIVEPTNRAYIRQCRAFFEQIQQTCHDDDAVSIKVVDGRFFVNELFVAFKDSGDAATSTLNDWDQGDIGGVRFCSDVSEDDLRHFFSIMVATRSGATDPATIQQELDQLIPSTIELMAAREADDETDQVDRRRHLRAIARTNFFRAISVVQEVMSNTEAERQINLAKTRRVVHSLIDHIERDENSLLELASIKDFDDYTYAHSINVSVYSLTIGVRIGLDRPTLSRLGFAALFHDIGKVKLQRDLIRKPDAFDENDWLQMQKHPLLGAKTILRNLKLDEYTARAARGAFEHHINADFTGYPSLRLEKRQPNLFSRIIAIADTFDALSSGRVYLKKSMTADVVMKKMQFQMRIKFDPFLLKIFSNVMGIYPAGTLVLLSTDELGVVLTNNELHRDRPFVKIVGDRNGLQKEAIWADLTQPEHQHRSIVGMIEPERYGLNAREFILAD